MKSFKIIFVSLLVLVPLCLHAQAKNSESDTLRVGEATYISARTIRVPILMRNTFAVSAISFRLSYDGSALTLARIDTVGTRIAPVYNEIASTDSREDGWVFWMGVNMNDPYNNHVPPGSGPIVYLVFNVKEGVDTKRVRGMRFDEDREAGHYNALSTQGGQLVFPILATEDFHLDRLLTAVQGTAADPRLPTTYFLGDCTPNPFEERTQIVFACPASENGPAHVAVRLYDSGGRLVATVVDDERGPGWHSVEWNVSAPAGGEVPAGVYFCRMEVNEKTVGIRKLVLLK